MRAPGLWLLTGLVPACTSSMQETAQVEQGACIALEGRTFASVDELACGPAPESAGRCRWQLTFDVESARASQFTWLHSDLGEAGQVRCDGGVLTATIGTRTLQATFDPATLRLRWAGTVYVAQ